MHLYHLSLLLLSLSADCIYVPRGWEGHFWAEPSLEHLRTLLRHTASHPEEVRQRGLAARRSMVERFSYDQIGPLVAGHIDRIEESLLLLGVDARGGRRSSGAGFEHDL
jgi:hypothetical protein